MANIPTVGGVEGFANGFDVAALAQQLSGNTDYFGIRYTGSIHVATGGSYTFYTISDDGSALYIDGVLVVNNDFSQGATERSGAVTLTAGMHAIEIRYFEGGGGEELQVHVSGPDTADIKTALLESALVGTATANVAITVLAVNDAPELANFGDTTVAVEQTAARLDLDVTVSDAELDTLNGGAGLYTGASFTLARTGGAVAEDVFGFDTTGALFTVSGNDLKSGGVTFATIVNADGMLSITFTSAGTPATTALVNDVLRHITYTNTSDTPPGQVALEYVFSDGNSETIRAGRSWKHNQHEDGRHRAGRRPDDPRRRQRDHEREFGRLHQGARQRQRSGHAAGGARDQRHADRGQRVLSWSPTAR